MSVLNKFYVIGLLLYTLKTSENLEFPDVFRGYGKRSQARSGLNQLIYVKDRVNKLIINKTDAAL